MEGCASLFAAGGWQLYLHKHRGKLFAPLGSQQFLKSVLVQFIDKGIEGGVKVFLEAADSCNGTGVGFQVEALHEAQIGFGVADHFTEADVLGIALQANTAGTSGKEIDIAVLAEGVHDADEVVF